MLFNVLKCVIFIQHYLWASFNIYKSLFHLLYSFKASPNPSPAQRPLSKRNMDAVSFSIVLIQHIVSLMRGGSLIHISPIYNHLCVVMSITHRCPIFTVIVYPYSVNLSVKFMFSAFHNKHGFKAALQIVMTLMFIISWYLHVAFSRLELVDNVYNTFCNVTSNQPVEISYIRVYIAQYTLYVCK